MAASTLHSFLIKLGFDVAGLIGGGSAARSELHSLATAARETAAAAAPASKAFDLIGTSAAAAGKMAGPLVTNLNQIKAASGPLVTVEQAHAEAMRASTAAAGPLVSAEQALVNARRQAASAAGPLVSAEQMRANAMRESYAAAGPLITSTHQTANALRAAGGAATPLVAGIRGANGAMAAAAPAANLAAAGFQVVGRNAMAAAAGMAGVPPQGQKVIQVMNQVAAAAHHVAERSTFMNRTLSMAFAFSGGVAVTTAIGFISNAILGFNSRLEQARIAFTTLLGSAGAADQFITKMERFAELTPFSFQGVEEAAQRLMAMGFTAQQVIPVLTSVGDAVAALGGNTEKLDRITIALGQMATAGRVNSQDMRQLTEAGIPAWQMLADGIGKTVAETRKMAEDGLIPANQALEILVNTMEQRFGGMMARQARTAQGAFSTIRDVMLQTISSAVQPLFEAISQGMVGMADFLITGGGRFIAPAIQAIGIALAVFLIPKLYGAATAIAATTVAVHGLIIPMLPLIITITALATAWQENFGGMRTTLGPIVGQVVSFADSLLQAANASGLLVPLIITLATAISAKLIISFIGATAAAAANVVAMAAVGLAMRATTGAGVAAIPVLNAVGASLYRINAAVAVLLGPIAAFAVAFGLLIMFSKQVTQGFRLVQDAAMGVQQSIFELQAQIPFIGDSAKKSLDAIIAARNKLRSEFNTTFTELQSEKTGGTTAADPMEDFNLKFKQGVAAAADQGKNLIDTFAATMDGVREAAKVGGGDAMLEFAKAIMEKSDAPEAAWQAALDITKNALNKQQQIARDVGILMSPELAAGLRSGIPEVAAAWVAVQKTAEENLNRNTGGAFDAGVGAGHRYVEGLRQALETEEFWGGKGRLLMDVAEIQKQADEWKAMVPPIQSVTAAMNRMNAEIASGASNASAAADAFLKDFGSSLDTVKEVALQAGADFMANYAQGIAQNADAPLNAMKDLLNLQKTALEPAVEEARLIGLLTSNQLASGLNDARPAVVAQSVATAKFIMDALNQVTSGAYAVGYNAIIALANGMISPSAFAALNKAAAATRFIMALAAGQDYGKALAEYRAAINLVVPSFTAAKSASDAWFSSLKTGATSSANSMKTAIADAKDKIKSAFADIKAEARKYFDEVHDKNLRAIEDARDLANAKLQDKVDTAQTALDAKRANERLFQLQKAVAMATDAESRADAMLALADYQAQMQIDAQQRVADAQKVINDQKAAEEKKAENERYADQVAAFNRELAELQRYMLRHPEEWRRMQAKVLALLADYGITYISAGAELGKSFADGLRKSVSEAQAAARELAKAAAAAFNAKFKADAPYSGGSTPGAVPSPPAVPKAGTGAKIPQAQSGLWHVLENNLLANLHQDEMVVPADIAGMLRVIARGPAASSLRPMRSGAAVSGTAVSSATFGASRTLSETGSNEEGPLGGRTIVVQFGTEKFAELSDRTLAGQHDTYATPALHSGGQR